MIILIALCTGLAVFFAARSLSSGQREIALSLRRARTYGGSTLREAELGKSVSDRLVGPFAQRLAQIALRVTPKASLDEVRRKLRGAGLTGASPTTYLAGKLVASAVLAALGPLLAAGGTAPQTAIALGIGGAAAAFVFPDYYLSVRTRGRKEDLVAQLPDVLDLLTVSVEAGLGFDAAVVRVCERMQGPLVEELGIMLHEMRIGESRAKALKSFSERIDMTETGSFARSIIQADQLGISLGKILRVQAHDVRHRRQMAAEERAMKAPVKMLFPTAVFIFPAMFIVVLGPAMISILKTFGG